MRTIVGDSRFVLEEIETDSVDCCVTSPPYWRKKKYVAGGIGWEKTVTGYVDELMKVFEHVARVLKPTGSFWVNLEDTYYQKSMAGVPWRVAFALVDHGWHIRNDVIWSKTPRPDNARDRLSFAHEHLFHFTRLRKKYWYDDSQIRSGAPLVAQVLEKAVRSAKQRINVSHLNRAEKKAARSKLSELEERECNFTMLLRGQRTPGRKRQSELLENGFCFIEYDPRGGKMPDVINISSRSAFKPRDSVDHGAAFPEEICEIPILTSCPPGGTILDPFCGTGTVLRVAERLGRQSIGVEIAKQYLTEIPPAER